jgi:hypothetical protein
MITPIAGRAAWVRQLTALSRPSTKLVSWQPMAIVMAAGFALVMIGSPAGVSLRLSIASAGVAAANAFVLDDTAAVTLAASPTSLPVRRLYRVGVAALTIALWWIATVAVATHRIGAFPLTGPTLQLGMLVAVAVAVCAAAMTFGDRTTGGIAGATFTTALYATTFLPPQSWLPLPSHPDAPGATQRLLIVLVFATATFAGASRDPATRTPRTTQALQFRRTRPITATPLITDREIR